MEPLTRLLVPIDFSEVSGPLVDLASRIAREHSAELVLFHAIEESIVNHVVAGYNVSLTLETLENEAKNRLEQYKARAEASGARVRIYEETPVADPAIAIVNAARDARASEILIASRGWGLRRLFTLGSTSRLVLKLSETPVILVKAVREDDNVRLLLRGGSPFGTILYAINRGYSEESLDYISKLAAKTRSRIVLLHVQENSETGFIQDVERTLAYRGLEIDKVVAHGKPHEVIKAYAEASGANSIFLEGRTHEGLKSLFLGSTLDRVINHSEIPVIVHPHRR